MAPMFLLISADEQPCTELVVLVAQTAYTRTERGFSFSGLAPSKLATFLTRLESGTFSQLSH